MSNEGNFGLGGKLDQVPALLAEIAELRQTLAVQERWLDRFLEAGKAIVAGDNSKMDHLVKTMDFVEELIAANKERKAREQ